MTTFEHALLGVNGALALGLHQRYGWRVVALAGAAAILPDWDGFPMLFDMSRFESGHRVWGHNLLACLVAGLLFGSADWYWNLSGRLVEWLSRFGVKATATEIPVDSRSERRRWLVWVSVATLAALTQIPADAVVSGGQGLTDWALKPLWPFSETGFVYPMVPWGNIGMTVIFAVGMILLAKFPLRAQSIAVSTLTLVALFVLVWGSFIRDRAQELSG